MWRTLKIGLLTILFFVCLPVSLYAASSVDGSSIQQAEQPMTMTVRLDQWNTLKKELIAQENDLGQLKQKLQMLKSTLSEQMQLLENLQNELNATKKSLTECEQLTDRMSKRTERIEGIIADIEQSNKSSGT